MVNTRAQIKKTQTGALIGSNDDLLMEILLRLPLTSVLQFRSVSKHWRSLLSQPPFTLLYKNGSISPGLFVQDFYIPFNDKNKSPYLFPNLDLYPDHHGIVMEQSCNGLLLFSTKRGLRRNVKYYVFNPTTMQFGLIPSVPGGGNVRRTICYMGLAFHPTDCVRYKVVCIHYVKPDVPLYQIQIHSSDTGSWKIAYQSFSITNYTSFNYGVYWHHAIHWFLSVGNPCYLKLDTEEVKSLPLPVGVGVSSFGGYRPLYFGESRGHLHLVERVDRRSSFLHLNVYEMLNDYSGWFVKYRVELDEVVNAYPEMIRGQPDPRISLSYDFHVLDVIRGEEDHETFMVIRIVSKIIRYNVPENSFKQIFDLSTCTQRPIYQLEVHRYIETKVSF